MYIVLWLWQDCLFFFLCFIRGVGVTLFKRGDPHKILDRECLIWLIGEQGEHIFRFLCSCAYHIMFVLNKCLVMGREKKYRKWVNGGNEILMLVT